MDLVPVDLTELVKIIQESELEHEKLKKENEKLKKKLKKIREFIKKLYELDI